MNPRPVHKVFTRNLYLPEYLENASQITWYLFTHFGGACGLKVMTRQYLQIYHAISIVEDNVDSLHRAS